MGHGVEIPCGDDLVLELVPSLLNVGQIAWLTETATCFESPGRNVMAFDYDVGIIGKSRCRPPDSP